MYKNSSAYLSAVEQLPIFIKDILKRIPEDITQSATEIRLRSDRPVIINCTSSMWYVNKNSYLSDNLTIDALILNHEKINECFKALCAYSVHSYEEYIKNGFIPILGGHRVGICGTAVYEKNIVLTIKNITSLNIRIARTKKILCDEQIIKQVNEKSTGTILAGEPGSGKTTVLRNIIDLYSKREMKIAVIDERFEILPVSTNGFCEKMPIHCDVLSGYPKHIGMIHALRSLAPDIILCDEIGSFEDVHAVENVANAGVFMFVSMHGDSLCQILKRPQAKALIKTGAFEKIIFLQGKTNPGKVREVVSLVDYF